MASDPFAAPLLKIERAKHHIADLNGQINTYLARRPFRLFVRQYPELAERHLVVETKPPIPLEFSLLIGDAIHNLRSALDIMIFGLIGDKVSSPDNLYFPMCKRKEALKDTITGREIHIAGKDIVAAIESLEPYPNGKYSLYAIHEMNICDKHRLVAPVGRSAVIETEDLRKIDPGLEFLTRRAERMIFVGDSENPVLTALTLVNIPRNEIARVNEEAKIQPAFGIRFGQRHPLAGKVVVKALYELVTACEHAVGEVRKAAV